MPGTRCAVAVCSNSLLQTKRENLQVTYHKFPKNEETHKVWVSACRRKDKWNPRTSTICSQHFTEDDYEVDLKAKLLNIPHKPRLKPFAVPTLLLMAKDVKKSARGSVNRRKKRIARKRPKVMEENLPCNIDPCAGEILHVNNTPIKVEEYTKEKYDKLLQEHEELKEKYKKIQEEFEEQKRQLENTEKLLTNLTTKLQSQTQGKEEFTLVFVR